VVESTVVTSGRSAKTRRTEGLAYRDEVSKFTEGRWEAVEVRKWGAMEAIMRASKVVVNRDEVSRFGEGIEAPKEVERSIRPVAPGDRGVPTGDGWIGGAMEALLIRSGRRGEPSEDD
jgi:hypothetical protein